jgi:alkylhydroperoxidase family enzyme
LTHTAIAVNASGDRDMVCAAIAEPESAPVTDRMRALAIAGKVQRSGKEVTPSDVDAARAAGGGDEDIHDTVLVAAAFCMFNRYVDGLAAATPTDPAVYEMIGEHLAENGYA